MEEIKKMHSSLTFSWRPIGLLAVAALVVSACGGGTTTTRPSVAAPSTSAAASVAAPTDAASAEPSEEASTEPSEEASEEASTEASTEPSEEASEEASTEPSEEASTEPSEEASTDPSQGGTVDLTGASFNVGSKEFTEQLILGQITVAVLEDAGATTEYSSLVGSTIVREALVGGDIDMYWEYTGTGWINHLGNATPVVGAEEQYIAVRDADAANGIVWLVPAPLDNTYAIALPTETATELNLTTLSDLATYANENPDGATLCAASEFLGRDDGLPGLQTAYGFEFSDVATLELGIIPSAIDSGQDCVFGEVFATDSRIASLGLVVLEDDLAFFASYAPSLNVTQEVFDANPGLAELFAPVAAALDTVTMQGLNARLDSEGEDPADIAASFLQEQGLIGE